MVRVNDRARNDLNCVEGPIGSAPVFVLLTR